MIVTRGLGLDTESPILVTCGLGIGAAEQEERSAGRSKNRTREAQERRRRVEYLLANTGSAIQAQAVRAVTTPQIATIGSANRTSAPQAQDAIPWSFYSWSADNTYPTVQGWLTPSREVLDFIQLEDEALAILLAMSV